ncbi:hypothetical protein JKP88DRAFT_353798 [Tribonema minus]|uniref:Uncharacterized protein n=1 Tax=Tribonema minus TaxID=303371 RepID=A0A835Z5X9_9STRA|nr:hypothetical protein JKP88DRAFT_353798 [Tribonema minus]
MQVSSLTRRLLDLGFSRHMQALGSVGGSCLLLLAIFAGLLAWTYVLPSMAEPGRAAHGILTRRALPPPAPVAAAPSTLLLPLLLLCQRSGTGGSAAAAPPQRRAQPAGACGSAHWSGLAGGARRYLCP